MDIQKFEIEGLLLLTPKIFSDERGFFCERFNENTFHQIGLKDHFVQDNFSRSKAGVLRGLHYQSDPPQGKLVSCSRGRIQDVAVDLRKNSSTFGKYCSIILSGDKPQWFYIPVGFAHGFLVISDEGADVIYKVNAKYNPQTEGSILWNDPLLKIKWDTSDCLLSNKDLAAKKWQDFLNVNPFI